MSTGKYILVNGSFIPAEEYRLTIEEVNGFLFSEKLRAVRTSFPFFKETLEMIKLKLMLFNQSYPDFTGKDGAGLKRQLERTLTKNKLFMGAVFTLSFYLSGDRLSYSIQSEKHENTDYVLNEKGLYIAVFDKIQKPVSPLSSLSLGSEVYWDIARQHQKSMLVDEVLLVNTNDLIIEIPEGNIYLLKGKTVLGTVDNQGSFSDLSSDMMIRLFRMAGLNFQEGAITLHDLQNAEEIMLVNTIDGIRWVVGFEGKRYFNNTIRKINDLFNQTLFS